MNGQAMPRPFEIGSPEMREIKTTGNRDAPMDQRIKPGLDIPPSG